jgi:hypothetical protein
MFQLFAGIGAGVVAYLFAPNLSTQTQWTTDLRDFFPTAATVIAALLIAVAIESRLVTRARWLAIATFAGLAIAELSSMAALSEMPGDVYHWLFALIVGGGASGLFAVCAIGAKTLYADKEAIRQQNLADLARMAKS